MLWGGLWTGLKMEILCFGEIIKIISNANTVQCAQSRKFTLKRFRNIEEQQYVTWQRNKKHVITLLRSTESELFASYYSYYYSSNIYDQS